MVDHGGESIKRNNQGVIFLSIFFSQSIFLGSPYKQSIQVVHLPVHQGSPFWQSIVVVHGLGVSEMYRPVQRTLPYSHPTKFFTSQPIRERKFCLMVLTLANYVKQKLNLHFFPSFPLVDLRFYGFPLSVSVWHKRIIYLIGAL